MIAHLTAETVMDAGTRPEFHRDPGPHGHPYDLDRQMIRLSLRLKRPLVLRVRDAFDEVVRMFEEEGGGRFAGVFHCFQGDATDAQRAVEPGFRLGLGGAITCWGAEKRRVDHPTALEAMLLETDAPWLRPAPDRGWRNDSSKLSTVVNTIAVAADLAPSEVAEVTAANARATIAGLGSGGAEAGGKT